MDIPVAIERCRARARAYFAAHQVTDDGALHWRHSATHDPARDPALLLYGTWAGVQAGVLLDGPRAFAAEERYRIAAGLSRYQRTDGSFMLPVISDRDGQTDEYIAFHCTNYAWGALRALALPPLRAPSFLEPLLDGEALTAWLARRNFQRPWTEGNNIINLASFYALLRDDGHAEAGERLEELCAWHDARQHGRTGLWHDDGTPAAALGYAIAGGAHNLHLYYYLGRDVPNAPRIIDSCLSLGYLGVDSACFDLDVVDILTHLRGTGHRRQEIDHRLLCYLIELLQVQNADGGFCDNYVTPHRTFGHVTPAGRSVTWVTWFRLATIGMIAWTLWPEQRGRWWFRTTLGSGYFNPAIAGRGQEPPVRLPVLSPTRRSWLVLRRQGRWLRQRSTTRIRRWMERSQ